MLPLGAPCPSSAVDSMPSTRPWSATNEQYGNARRPFVPAVSSCRRHRTIATVALMPKDSASAIAAVIIVFAPCDVSRFALTKNVIVLPAILPVGTNDPAGPVCFSNMVVGKRFRCYECLDSPVTPKTCRSISSRQLSSLIRESQDGRRYRRHNGARRHASFSSSASVVRISGIEQLTAAMTAP